MLYVIWIHETKGPLFQRWINLCGVCFLWSQSKCEPLTKVLCELVFAAFSPHLFEAMTTEILMSIMSIWNVQTERKQHTHYVNNSIPRTYTELVGSSDECWQLSEVLFIGCDKNTNSTQHNTHFTYMYISSNTRAHTRRVRETHIHRLLQGL